MKVKFTFEIRIVRRNSLALMGHHNEVYGLRNEISSLKSIFNNSKSNRTETDNQITIDTLNKNILETKIVFPEKENSPIRSEIQNKQDTIQKLLKNNITLVELINTNFMIQTHSKTELIKSKNKDLKISRKIQKLETISSETKMRDPQETKGKNKKARRHVCTIYNSILENITGPGISKLGLVQVKAHPGATTDNIIDYIKLTIRQNTISLLLILERMT